MFISIMNAMHIIIKYASTYLIVGIDKETYSFPKTHSKQTWQYHWFQKPAIYVFIELLNH